MKKRFLATLITFILLFVPASALAQDYYFQLPQMTVDVYWNADGSESINYTFVFQNDPSGHSIEYVDVGIPNGNFNESNILADVNGIGTTDISRSGFQGKGSDGVAVGLGPNSIAPGNSGTVHVFIPNVQGVVYPDDKDKTYASAVFKPSYFGSQYVNGSTDMTVRFHLPPGVQPTEPRWHAAPSGFPSEPVTGLDDLGNITYTWQNPSASGSEVYTFGASFPMKYIPEQTIVKPNPFAFLQNININSSACLPWFCILGFVGIIVLSSVGGSRRKMQYLPPKISIEGHGIKRGLTAVEAAILLEQPLDKVLTMILFGVLKKEAGQVVTRDPLEVQATEPLPAGLHDYETQFLNAFKEKALARQRLLQEMVVNLIKGVSEKMKGFSRRETIEYYKNITAKAWEQVEAENTPEVKSQKLDEVLEWTMLDKDYDHRTQDVFRTQPIFVPMWWGRYDPSFGRSTSGIPKVSASPMPSSRPSGGASLPHLPGSDFAASLVNGVQGFSSKVVGNINTFTNNVTQKTNPVPVSTTRSGGGFSGRSGGGCACACACAGCACACAGGGR